MVLAGDGTCWLLVLHIRNPPLVPSGEVPIERLAEIPLPNLPHVPSQGIAIVATWDGTLATGCGISDFLHKMQKMHAWVHF